MMVVEIVSWMLTFPEYMRIVIWEMGDGRWAKDAMGEVEDC